MLDINLLPKQWEVFNPVPGVDYDITLYQGGVGSGKTFLGSLKGLRVLSQNHGARWLVGADTYERLKISTCETYLELLDDAKVIHRYNKQDHVLRIPGWDDAQVLFKGVDDPLSLRSVNGIGGHLEESSMLKERSYLEFLGRLRQAKNGTPIEVILTTNPQTTKGWQYQHFVVDAGIHSELIRDKEVKVSRRRVVAATLDNPYVPDAFIASLKASYDEEMWRMMVMGEDGDYTAGLVCKTWSDANIDSVDFDPDLRVYLTCDFNIDPNCWELAHRAGEEYHFFDELCLENSTTLQSAEEFYRRYKEYASSLRIIITGDASGDNRSTQAKDALTTNYTILRNTLSSLGFRDVQLDLRSRNPNPDARVAAWNAMVCNSLGARRIKVSPRCKWLIYNCENLKYIPGTSVIWEPTIKQIEQDKNLKFTKHPFDAASYLVERYDPIKLEAAVKNKPRILAQPFTPKRNV